MFQVNDSVLYGAQGVCTVVEIVRKENSAGSPRNTMFYVRFSTGRTRAYCVPVHNKALTAKMRRVLSKKEVLEIVGQMADMEPAPGSAMKTDARSAMEKF